MANMDFEQGFPACANCPTYVALGACSAADGPEQAHHCRPQLFKTKQLTSVTLMINPAPDRKTVVVYAGGGDGEPWLVSKAMAPYLGIDRVAAAHVAEFVTAQGTRGIWIAPVSAPGKQLSTWNTSAYEILLSRPGEWLRIQSAIGNRWQATVDPWGPADKPTWLPDTLLHQLSEVFYGRVIASLRDLSRFDREGARHG